MKNIKNIVIVVLSMTVVLLTFFIVKLKLYENIEQKNNTNNNAIKFETEQKEYDCSFTKTWRVVDKMDGYVAEVPEKSYVILDKFQSHNAYAHPILTNLKEDLEVDKYYEFTYQVKGTGIINDISDITRYITDESLEEVPNGVLRVKLSIKETNKQGLDQIQEDICK